METISLTVNSYSLGLFWLTSNLAAVLPGYGPIEFIEFGTKRKENLKLTINSELVQFVVAGPAPGTVIVLFVRFPGPAQSSRIEHSFTIYKLTEHDLQIVEEFVLDLPLDLRRTWYPLHTSDSSGNFYISTNQDVLLVREKHPPTLLQLHEKISGRLTSLGLGMFTFATEKNVRRFCRFRLNRDGASVFAEMLGPSEVPSGDRTLIARTKDSTFGQRFWWQQDKSGTMIVTQETIDVRRDVCFSDYNGNVSGISATTTAADQQCYILSIDGKSVLVSLENRELRAIETPSWQVLDEETVFADDRVQVTRTQIVWRNGTAVTFDDRINSVSCQGSLLAIATNECAYVYFKGEEVKTINVENTIISISCNAVGVVAVLTFDKLIVYDHPIKSMEERASDVFCTAVIVTDSGAVRVGTGRGELLGDTDLKISRFPIRKILTYGSDLIVADTSANAYLVSQKGEMTRLSLGITHSLLPLTGDDYLTVFEGEVQVVRFSTSAPRCYENSTVSAFPGAPDSIKYSCGSFYAFYKAKREVHVATPQNFVNSTVHHFVEVENMSQEDDSEEDDYEEDDYEEDDYEEDDYKEDDDHQFFLDSSRILEIIIRDNGAWTQRVIVRLHKVDPNSTKCLLLHKKEVSVYGGCGGDCCSGPSVKFVKSSQMFFALGTNGVEAFGKVVSDRIILRDFGDAFPAFSPPDHTDDLWVFEEALDIWMFDETYQEVISVTRDGHVKSKSIEDWDFPQGDSPPSRASVYSLGRILDWDAGQRWSDIFPLSRKHVYVATIGQRGSSRVVVFSVDGVVSILANFAIPDVTNFCFFSFLPSDDVSLDQNGGDFTPDFYIGTRDGALYSVSLLQDSELVKSLGVIQLSLLQDMGFDENLEGYLNGSLLQAAAQHQDYEHLFEENGVSAESVSTNLLNLIG